MQASIAPPCRPPNVKRVHAAAANIMLCLPAIFRRHTIICTSALATSVQMIDAEVRFSRLRTCKDDAGDDWCELPRQRERQHAANRSRQAQLCEFPHKLRACHTGLLVSETHCTAGNSHCAACFPLSCSHKGRLLVLWVCQTEWTPCENSMPMTQLDVSIRCHCHGPACTTVKNA